MRPGIVLTLVVAGIVVSASNLRAEEAAQSCDVPDSLLATDSSLNKVADAVKNGRPLDVLVVGSRSSTIVSSDSSAYPARLQVALKEKLLGEVGREHTLTDSRSSPRPTTLGA